MHLSDKQFAAVYSNAPRLLIRSSAGSGKTHVLTHRIAAAIQAGADPSKVVAISFTCQAGRILADRLAALGITGLRHVGTLHALCLAEAHKFPTWGYKRPLIIDEDMQAAMIKAELARLRLDKTVSIRDVAATLSVFAADKAKPAVSNRAYGPAKAVRRAMVEAGQASMDMLLGEAVAYLPGCLGGLDALYIDEFQDSAPADYALLESIEAKSKTVVGDEMQSIFGFRGSSPDYFRHLAAHGDWQQLTLADNYRSNAAIVASANRLTAGQAGAIAMRHIRPDDWTPPTIGNYATESAEFDAIREWLAAHPTGSRAILCRHNALAERLRLALADALPPSPALALDPAMIRQAMRAVQNPGETWHDHHDALPYVRHFTEACGSNEPAALLPAMAEALAQAEAQASYDFGGLYIGTVHGAKGNEFTHVLVAGCDSKAWADTPENRRLFYVALTRGMDSVTFTSAEQRQSMHGKGMDVSQPTKFLSDL